MTLTALKSRTHLRPGKYPVRVRATKGAEAVERDLVVEIDATGAVSRVREILPAPDDSIEATAANWVSVITRAPAGAVIRVRPGEDINVGATLHAPALRNKRLTIFADGATLRNITLGTSAGHNYYKRIIGGTISPLTPGDAGLDLNRVGVVGWEIRHVTFTRADMHIRSWSHPSHWLKGLKIRNCRFEDCARDSMRINSGENIELAYNEIWPPRMVNKACTFVDGRAPVYGISKRVCEADGGKWKDSGHGDILQAAPHANAVIASLGVAMSGMHIHHNSVRSPDHDPVPQPIRHSYEGGFGTFGARVPLRGWNVHDNIMVYDGTNGIALWGATGDVSNNILRTVRRRGFHLGGMPDGVTGCGNSFPSGQTSWVARLGRKCR